MATDASHPRLSVVLPARNEQAVIEQTLRTVSLFLSEVEPSHEIIVGDSGSVDETGERARRAGVPHVRVVREDREGKGRILSRCLIEARAPIVGFLDADLEIPVTTLSPLLEAIREGADVAIAAKTPRTGERPPMRRAVSRVYNDLVAFFLRSHLPDHQAGCKLFRSDVLRPALLQTRSVGWLWDTEVLVRLVRAGARVDAIPCVPGPARPSRVQLSSAVRVGCEFLGLCARLRSVDGVEANDSIRLRQDLISAGPDGGV